MPPRFRYAGPGTWHQGALHLHTDRSDGLLPPAEVVARYAAAGYDFVALTDHWRQVDPDGLPRPAPLTVLDGIEVDADDGAGNHPHVTGIGSFTGLDRTAPLADTLAAMRDQGGFLTWAHPHWTLDAPEAPLRGLVHAVEVYNHGCRFETGRGHARWHWDRALDDGLDLLGLAVDDAHFRPEIPAWNGGWVMVDAPDTRADSLRAALHDGAFYASTGPRIESLDLDGDRLVLRCSPAAVVRLVGPDHHGRLVHAGDDGLCEAVLELPAAWAWHRLEVEDAAGRVAWSNPLFAA